MLGRAERNLCADCVQPRGRTEAPEEEEGRPGLRPPSPGSTDSRIAQPPRLGSHHSLLLRPRDLTRGPSTSLSPQEQQLFSTVPDEARASALLGPEHDLLQEAGRGERGRGAARAQPHQLPCAYCCRSEPLLKHRIATGLPWRM